MPASIKIAVFKVNNIRKPSRFKAVISHPVETRYFSVDLRGPKSYQQTNDRETKLVLCTRVLIAMMSLVSAPAAGRPILS